MEYPCRLKLICSDTAGARAPRGFPGSSDNRCALDLPSSLIAENSGHFIAEEDPEIFSTTLERFLSA
jgi:hypothetical protein